MSGEGPGTWKVMILRALVTKVVRNQTKKKPSKRQLWKQSHPTMRYPGGKLRAVALIKNGKWINNG